MGKRVAAGPNKAWERWLKSRNKKPPKPRKIKNPMAGIPLFTKKF